MEYAIQYPAEPALGHWVTDAEDYVWHHEELHVWECVNSGYRMAWEDLIDKYGPLNDHVFPVMGDKKQ